MDEVTAQSLLESIAAERLVVLIGAGLSMAPPSDLPSAASIARRCSERYDAETGQPLEADLRNDLEKMAAAFIARNAFDSLFIGKLVPWPEFHRQPNTGHDAIADFLACGVLVAGITTNVDCLVEAAAARIGEPDFWPIVEQADLPSMRAHRPYLKVHGCEQKCRRHTVWCREQLTSPPVCDRMQHFRNWLATNLVGRDLLVVGFWSDWKYLNELLAENLPALGPRSVILVDPDEPMRLEAKAPLLWRWAHGTGIAFSHVRQSAADFLHDLRCRWSRAFLRRLTVEAAETHQKLFSTPLDASQLSHDAFDAPSLYALRRDLTGASRTEPTRCREPRPCDHIAAAIHARLVITGSRYVEHSYLVNGRRVRVISAPGQLLSAVKHRYGFEPPLQPPVAQTVCAGAFDDPAPAHLVRGSQTPTIIRSGLAGEWLTHEAILPELVAL